MKTPFLFFLPIAFLSCLCISTGMAQPVITGTSPAANQRNVPQNTAVAVDFSQTITAGSASALRVFSNQRGGLRTGNSGTNTASANRIAFSPAYNFQPGETVQVIATRTAQSSGGSLAQPRAYQFTTVTNGGSGVFVNRANTPVGDRPYIVVTADVDSDGDLDMLTPNFYGNSVSIRLNNGAGIFSGSVNVSVGSQPRGLVMTDLDGDGDLDFATSNYNANTMTVRLNNGAGVFSGGGDFAVGSQPQSIVAADLDGDGDQDLLVSNGAGSNISVSINNGNATFNGAADVPVASFPFNLTVADVDNDGDMDIISGDYYSNTVSVRFNNGTAVFNGNTQVVVGTAPRGVAMADLDGDGDLDLLAANAGSNSVSIRFNNGAGAFSGTASVAVGMSPGCVATADVDSDGDLDLLTTNIGSNTVSIRLNNGAGVFGSGSDLLVGSEPYRVAAADIDNDGDLDLLAANFSGNSVSVLLNQPPLPRAGIVGDSVVCNGGQVQLTATGTAPIVAYRWSTGATTASILVAQPGLYGVSVTFGGGTVGTAQYRVGAVALAARIAGDTLVCAGQPVSLSAVAAGARTYRWSTGATTPTISVSQAGTYSVVVSYGTGCASTAQQRVRAGLAGPVFSLGADTLACAGEAVVLRGPALSRPGLAYRWSDGSAGRTLRVTQAGTYSLQLLGECGTGPVSRRVDFRSCLTIPNVFTPNQDGRNDRFEIRGIAGGTWALQVYSRWGQKLFETAAYQNDWGREAAAGVYYYVLSSRANPASSYKGWVEVVR